ncbi:deoxyribonuclease IV [Candidatus Omnitrophota bacterium]
MRLGVQVSIAGKIFNAVNRAEELRCNTMQIFTHSPREFRHGKLSAADIKEFKKRRQKTDISPVFVHMPYVVNLASPRRRVYERSITIYIEEVQQVSTLGAEYLVTHMGSHRGEGEAKGLRRFCKGMNVILKETQETKVSILLENTAGSGHSVGHNFKHMRQVLETVSWNKRLGVCLDTCHAFVAGFDLSTPRGLARLINEIDKNVGIERVKLIHLNDARDALGSLRDRHDHIGKGKIGIEGFKYIVNHPKLRKVPLVLETPKSTDDDDKINLEIIRRIKK